MEGDALVAEVEALEGLVDEDGPVNDFPARVVQDSFSGELVLTPRLDVEPGDPRYFMSRIAVTTAPFGFPSQELKDVIEDRYLKPNDVFDEALQLACGTSTWQRDLYTSSLDVLVISPARTTLVRDEPDLLPAGTAEKGAWPGGAIREVTIEDEDGEDEGTPEPGMSQRIGVTVREKAKAGGLGKLKDYSKRKKDMPNPYAPAQVTTVKGDEAFLTPEAIERSMALFRLGDDQRDPHVLERHLLRVPPNVMFERGLGAADVLRVAGVPEGERQESMDHQPMADGKDVVVNGNDNGSDGKAAAAAPAPVKPARGMKLSLQDLLKELEDTELFEEEEAEEDKPPDEEEEEEEGRLVKVQADLARRDEEEKQQATDRRDRGLLQATALVDVEAKVAEDAAADVDDIIVRETSSDATAPKKKASKYQRPRNQAAVSSTKHNWCVTTKLDVSDFKALVPRMAMEYPFELDDFQKQAVARLERGEYVFVAAHTSAGKTVVAEYAIALAMLHMTRAVYTSPIKALSNQKYRDFKERFGDKNVGLITGDVSVNPDASCLIMTTEILRSMLYRGADLIRDIEWVIFDEVHYVNDTERGVVWEEVIIMLPDHVSMVFLSATTPNTQEFSDWVGRTRKRPVHVITTNYRPVPLQHNLWAGNELHKVLDPKTDFDNKGYSRALESFKKKEEKEKAKAAGGGGRGGGGRRGGGGSGGGGRSGSYTGGRGGGGGMNTNFGGSAAGGKTQWIQLVNRLKTDSLMPTVVFNFSKKKCEECANFLSSESLNDQKEKSQVHLFATAAIKRLQEKDQSLPQVMYIVEMCKRGIGVHHGGLLPILKEIVEILFSRGLIKVLFATETFAMGVNMPARTVVFNSMRKHDGRDFRDLLPGEYTQMAGRAGRRGLDKVGTVIIACWKEVPPSVTLLRILTGSATKLQSQFRLTYNMILNLLRTEDLSVEDMIKRSFSEFATQRALNVSDVPAQLERVNKQLAKEKEKGLQPCLKGEPAIEDYYTATRKVVNLTSYLIMEATRLARTSGQSILGLGRFLRVTNGRLVSALALVVKLPQDGGAAVMADASPARQACVALVLCPEGFVPPRDTGRDKDKAFKPTTAPRSGLAPASNLDIRAGAPTSAHDEKATEIYGTVGGSWYALLSVKYEDIVLVSSRRLKKFDAEAVLSEAESGRAGAAVSEAVQDLVKVNREEPQGPPPLDLEKELKIKEMDFVQTHRMLAPLQRSVLECKCHTCPLLASQYAHVGKVRRLESLQGKLRHQMSNESLQLFPDFQQRLGVLEELGYINSDKVVQLKGRVACEVNTCEELLLTELVFENVFEPLDPAEIAGLLSALVCQEKSSDEPSVTQSEPLRDACQKVLHIARHLGGVQRAHRLQTDPEAYAQNVNLTLVDVVYDWAKGVSFADITLLTLVPEGSIVRCITRLDELCREVRNAARIIGSPSLYRKMEQASESIKRDIVFAGSLYLT